jgi:hypothetical protein
MRSPVVSPPLTLENAVDIWRRHRLGKAQHVIAAGLGVNQGRVSEVLSGKRFPEARTIASQHAA